MLHTPNKKIFLSPVEEENIEQLRQWRNRPDLRQYFREYKEISKISQLKWFTKHVNEDPNEINFEIHDYESNKLIGHCVLSQIKWTNRTSEFGIYIGDDSFLGKGYGKDALETLIKYGFEEICLNRIWAEVYSINENALNLYKKVGFEVEGILKQHVYKNGKFIDSFLIGLLKEKWDVI